MSSSQRSLPRLAYLTPVYPAVSHTFIQREVSGLRDLGFEVATCAMRQPGSDHLIGEEEQDAAASTFYIIRSGRNPLTLLRAAFGALAAPRRLVRTLALAVRTAPPGVKGTLKQVFYLGEAVLLARYLATGKIDHLHAHFAGPGAHIAMLTSALSDIPFSYTLHGPSDLYEPEKWQLREKTARAAFVACISHFARAQAMYFSDPDHWSKLRIVHCGVIPERYDSPAPTCETGLNLVFVGRISPVKGLRVLMDAFEAAHEVRSDLTLTLVGDGDERAALEERARSMGDAVRFLGFQSQDGVAKAVAQADAMVLPSFAEGLPVVLMEALAAARPVIATRVAGVAELVEDGVSGYLISAGDAAGLTDRILAMAATDPARRAEMGEAGRAKVRAEFDARTEAARIGTLFAGTGDDAQRPAPLSTETG